mgnify:CR=1 FL=1
MEFFTVLVLTYALNGHFIESKTVFPSQRACGDALPDYYEPIYKFDKESMGQCIVTDTVSKSIRPKMRPTND